METHIKGEYRERLVKKINKKVTELSVYVTSLEKHSEVIESKYDKGGNGDVKSLDSYIKELRNESPGISRTSSWLILYKFRCNNYPDYKVVNIALSHSKMSLKYLSKLYLHLLFDLGVDNTDIVTVLSDADIQTLQKAFKINVSVIPRDSNKGVTIQ